MRSQLRSVVVLASLAAALACVFDGRGMSAATATMPVSEVRAGMIGTGRTVFVGTRVEDFKAHILGVVANVMGPQRNLILAKLEGGPLADTGVIAGMSGSPVYVDGRLIGAVSYSLGSFSKEPIAGITPIDEMTADAAGVTVRPTGAQVNVEFPLTREGLIASFRKALNWNRPFADRAEDARFTGVPVAGLGGAELAPMLRPIATPLVISGMSDAADFLSSALGFMPMSAGAAGPGDMPFDGPLKPGDAVGVNFVDGDFLLGGTGTVTHIDGDKVYAFGHPMYNLGPTDFPMTRAYVYTVLPSLAASSKLATTGDTIGTFQHDRPTTIAGKLGAGPRMLPVSVTLKSDHAPTRTFNFRVVRDQLFTPLMTYTALVNVFASYERQFAASTFALQGVINVPSQPPVVLDNMFAGDTAPGAAANAVMAPLAALMGNDYEKVELEKLDLTIDSNEIPKTATLERIWIDDPRPRAGRTVPLKILLRPYRGEEVIRTLPLEIPANARGTLSVVVSDGTRLAAADQAEARQLPPRSVAQLVRSLNQARRNDTLYIRLISAEPGAVVRGERMAALPPSVMGVVEADRSTGGVTTLNSATVAEWKLETDQVVTGSRTIAMAVAAN